MKQKEFNEKWPPERVRRLVRGSAEFMEYVEDDGAALLEVNRVFPRIRRTMADYDCTFVEAAVAMLYVSLLHTQSDQAEGLRNIGKLLLEATKPESDEEPWKSNGEVP